MASYLFCTRCADYSWDGGIVLDVQDSHFDMFCIPGGYIAKYGFLGQNELD
jgi:hypothetical protein